MSRRKNKKIFIVEHHYVNDSQDAVQNNTEIDGNKKNKKHHGHFSFAKFKLGLFIVLALVVVAAGIYLYSEITSSKIERRHAELSSQIQKVAELTVLKNRYCDVICVRTGPEVKVAKASAIVKYNGVLRAGIADVSQIDVNVRDGGAVQVFVPHSQVLDNMLVPDQLELFDEKTFLFVKRIPTQEIFNGISDQMEIKKQEMIEDGILQEADLQLRSVIEGMLNACGFTEIEFNWKN